MSQSTTKADQDQTELERLRAQVAALQGRLQGLDGMEQELARSHLVFEQRVQERTAQLSAANWRLQSEVGERVKMEARLAEAAERFQRYFDQSPVGKAIVGLDLRFHRVNAELCRITGYQASELVEMTLADITHPNGTDQDMELARKLIDGEISQYDLDQCYVRKDGQTVWVRVSVALVHDAAGNPLHLLPVVQDINASKIMLEELKVSQQTAQVLLDSITESAVLLDMDGAVLAANHTAAARLGITLEEMIGRQADSLLPSKMALSRQVFVRRVLETRRAVRFEDTRAGQVLDNTYYPVTDEKGNVTRLAILSSDITDRKRAEEERKRSHEQLEELVQARTRELETKNRMLGTQAVRLEEMNAALRVLLEQREHDKQDYESQVGANVNNLVMPYLERVVTSRIPDEYKVHLDIAISNLRDLVTSFSATLISKANSLTPREIQVANLVREGKTNKEIAPILGVTSRAVEFHRANLRHKLGLKGKRLNLRSYLLSMNT